MSDTSVIANLRQPNKWYRCFQFTIAAGGSQDVDILTTLGVVANTVSITNQSDVPMEVILNDAAYDRVPLNRYDELAWSRDELQIDWVRIYNNGTTEGRIVLLATG